MSAQRALETPSIATRLTDVAEIRLPGSDRTYEVRDVLRGMGLRWDPAGHRWHGTTTAYAVKTLREQLGLEVRCFGILDAKVVPRGRTAPNLAPRTWYGFPAYAKDGEVVCFFQFAGKFKTRYATLGFSDEADLDEGWMWPVTYALTKITPAEEAKIAALVKRAIS